MGPLLGPLVLKLQAGSSFLPEPLGLSLSVGSLSDLNLQGELVTPVSERT